LISRLLQRYMTEEAAPTLDPIPGYDVDGYCRTAIDRFGNRYVRDTLARIATDASDRVATFLVPVALDGVRDARPTPLVAAAIAAWAHHAAGRPGNIPDRQQSVVDSALSAQRDDPAGFIDESRLFGALAASPRFAAAFTRSYELIAAHGPRVALAAILDER